MMKKGVLIIVTALISTFGFSQVTGQIKEDGRKLIKKSSFVLQGDVNGRLVFEISVNEDGKITSAKIKEGKSTVKNVREIIKTHEYILHSFQFEEGFMYPEFHNGEVAITLVKPVNESE